MNTALLMIDMQEQFRKKLRKRKNFIDTVKRVASSCARARIPVFHITTEFPKHFLPLYNRVKGLSICIAGTPQAREIAELEAIACTKKGRYRQGHYFLVKPHYDAFFATPLDCQLRCLEVDTVLIAGLYTHWCVLSTVFGALSRNYRVHVIEDCVMSEKKHKDLARKICKHIFDKKTDALRLVRSAQVIRRAQRAKRK